MRFTLWANPGPQEYPHQTFPRYITNRPDGYMQRNIIQDSVNNPTCINKHEFLIPIYSRHYVVVLP